MGRTDNARLKDWVYGQEGLSANEKFFLITLLQFRNNQTALCFPSYDTLSRLMSLSRSTVIRTAKSLRDKGLLDSRKELGKANHYTIIDGVVSQRHHKHTGVRLTPKPIYNRADVLDHPEWNDKLYAQRKLELLESTGLSKEDIQ